MRLDFKTDASMLMTEVSRMLGLAPILTMMIAVLMAMLVYFFLRERKMLTELRRLMVVAEDEAEARSVLAEAAQP